MPVIFKSGMVFPAASNRPATVATPTIVWKNCLRFSMGILWPRIARPALECLRAQPAVHPEPFLHPVHEVIGAAAFLRKPVRAGLEHVEFHRDIRLAPGQE